jgi:hypothetical protein
MDLPRDDRGLLVTSEPLYLSWTQRENKDMFRRNISRPPNWVFAPETWECREHPDWQGEDLPESLIAKWEESGPYADWPGGPRRVWEEESVQAHAALHESLK